MNSKVHITDNGDAMIDIPPEVLEELGWNQNTILSLVEIEGCIQIRQKTDWTVDQIQHGDNLEQVLEDIEKNGTVHHVLHEGRVVVIAPYSDELKGLLEK